MTGNHIQAGGIPVFKAGLYICEYDVPSTSNMVVFCTHHITLAVVNLVRNCRCNAPYQKGSTYAITGCDKGTNSGLKSQKRPHWGSNNPGMGWQKHGRWWQKSLSREGNNVHNRMEQKENMLDSRDRETTSVAGTQSEGCVCSEISPEGGAGTGKVRPQRPYRVSQGKMLILRGINRNSNISKTEVPFCAQHTQFWCKETWQIPLHLITYTLVPPIFSLHAGPNVIKHVCVAIGNLPHLAKPQFSHL